MNNAIKVGRARVPMKIFLNIVPAALVIRPTVSLRDFLVRRLLTRLVPIEVFLVCFIKVVVYNQYALMRVCVKIEQLIN